ncbi:MAG: hypothetical protein ACOX6T_19585 [Myxococcales bacterium]|jgi:hypothetical protein
MIARGRVQWGLAAAVLVGVALGCADGNSLDGSIGEAFDLSFSTVEIRRSATAFQVTYLQSEGREVIARITVATAGIDLAKPVELCGEYAPGHPRTTVSRAVDGEPLLVLPPVKAGRLELDRQPEAGQVVSGSFSIAFAEGGDIGAGRTLSGRFEGEVLPAR